MNLIDLFKENPNIIINTDIDGVLSGLLLVKYCDCKIIGFTNSKDKVWLADEHDDLYKGVYVDMFVTHPGAVCIDQHIVAVDMEHMKAIRNNKQLFSPQSDDIDNLRIFDSWGFKNKYPFGTFQYLVAQLESEGISIQLPNLYSKIPNSDITVGDLFNRPDDAMKTTLFSYVANAKNWWEWLENKAPNGSIAKLKSYLDHLASISDAKVDDMVLPNGKRHKKQDYKKQREKDIEIIKNKTREYFKNNFQCRTSDGGFNNVVDDACALMENIRKYINTIASIVELNKVVLPKHYNVHVGKYYRTCWLDIFSRDIFDNYLINNHKIFSYAFIFSPSNDGKPNFSFTVDMQ